MSVNIGVQVIDPQETVQQVNRVPVRSNTDEVKIIPNKVLYVNQLEYIDDTKVTFPKPLIDSLVNKWRTLFNTLLKKNKDVRLISAHLDTASFVNCFDVKFNTTHFTFDRLKKEFEIHVTPMFYQDILCFGSLHKKGMIIKVKSLKLRILFTKFFEQINRIRFCSDCGNFAHTSRYYSDVDMCEACLFEEISAAQKTETKTCSICQEESKRMYKTNCNHYFHRKCLAKIDPAPYPRCPMCRHALDPDDVYLDDEHHNHVHDGDVYDSYDENDVNDNESLSDSVIIHEGGHTYR